MRTCIVVLMVFSVCCCGKLASQENQVPRGKIIGNVLKETTNEVVPGANVVVLGTIFGASTDSTGAFVIEQISSGTYNIRISAVGFSPVVKTDVVVTNTKPAEIRITLVESTVEFDEVSVTAEYFQKSPDLPISTQLQSNEEIRRLPGSFEDVIRAVSILPGVAQVQPGRNDLIVRGGAPSENLFVIDNIEVPNINHFGTQGASGGPLSYVNLDFVRGTMFSTGGFGVRYGNKLSSVLSIDLREGRTDRFGGKATVSATQFGLNVEGPVAEHTPFFFSARRSYLDFIFKAAGFGFVPEYWDFLGKVTHQFGSRDQLSVLAICVIDNVRLFNDSRDQRYDNSKILISNQRQFVGGLTWRHLFRSGYSILTLSDTYNDYNTRQNDTLLQPIFSTISIEHQVSLRGEAVFELSKWTEILAGISGTLIRTSSDLLLRPFWTNYGKQLSAAVNADTTGVKVGWYSQVSQMFDRLRVTAGVRGDYLTLLTGSMTIAPRASLSYSLSPATTLNASIGVYYQDPSSIWLAANPNNKNLSPIRVQQYIAGIEHIVRFDTKVSLEAYWKSYNDYPASITQPYLIMANTGAGFGGSQEAFASFGIDPLVSAGSGNTRGLEVAVQKKLSEIPCYGIFSLSYNESRFTALDGVERPSSFDQRWILNIGGGYIFNERWEVSAKFRFASGRPYTPYQSDGTQLVTQYNADRIGINHSLDVRVDRRWMLPGWSLITYLDIQNIYNRKPQDIPRYNERLKQTEQPGAIGILPSIGISAEF